MIIPCIIRESEFEDCLKGLPEVLSELYPCEVGQTFESFYKEREQCGNIFTYVAVQTRTDKYKNIIGTASLILEPKLIHTSYVAHIEDVAVLKSYHGLGVGRYLVETLIKLSKSMSCYKCILNCSKENVAFYAKLGFKEHDIGMRLDLK